MKEKKTHKTSASYSKVKPAKKAHLKSQQTIAEEKALADIIPKAWAKVENQKKNHAPKHNNFTHKRSPVPKKKVHIKSQNTIMEEAQLEQIVGKAWLNVEQKKAKISSSPVKKPKKHVHLKSQNTIMEEEQLVQIVGKAWKNAEKMKEKTAMSRKKAAENKGKPKPHRQESILEEVTA